MGKNTVKESILMGNVHLGIELGSTRIKAMLISSDHLPLAQGSHDWENELENGNWTYHLDDVWTGLQYCYQALVQDVKKNYGVSLNRLDSIGISAMMHGYLVFDKQDRLLTPFRTWRNTSTEQAAVQLTEVFNFNIPQRWSIAHLYQAVLNDEQHVKDIGYLTTLAGYVHYSLTGQHIVGVGEASGIFPINSSTQQYNSRMMRQFNDLTEWKKYPWKLEEILPQVKTAGENAGLLSLTGAKLLDPTCELKPGAVLCPPEGDAGTGMVSTNSITKKTGNISAGTSIFAMIVLEKELSKVYSEIDMVTTPDGKPVAMVHCNTCTSDIDAWVNLIRESNELFGLKLNSNQVYADLYSKALEADIDCGGLIAYNYLAGEPVTGFEEGRPLFARKPGGAFTLSNFMRTLIFSSLSTLRIGVDILFEKENVKIDKLLGHGGFFKTKGVGQSFMASALETPIAVMETAGEGGAWGIAILAAFMKQRSHNETLESYLNKVVFAHQLTSMCEPDPKQIESFKLFLDRYKTGLQIERSAVESMK